MLKIAVEL